MIKFDFTDKVVCITGAGRGMGKETALKFAECGACVCIADLNMEDANQAVKDIEAIGGKAIAVKTDVTKKEEVFAMVDKAVETWGHVDIMVNNAGITLGKALVDVEESDLDKIYAVNVKGVLFGMQAAMKYFAPQKHGKIINLGSQAGKEAGATYGCYSSSKAAVHSLTQCMAKEAGQYNVNVNEVCPGMIMTGLWTKDTGDNDGLLLMMQEMDEYKGMSFEEIWAIMCKDMLLGRAQEPEDIAMLILFLASEYADNMTGQGVNITGGMMLH